MRVAKLTIKPMALGFAIMGEAYNANADLVSVSEKFYHMNECANWIKDKRESDFEFMAIWENCSPDNVKDALNLTYVDVVQE
jgi:hypothetical protein